MPVLYKDIEAANAAAKTMDIKGQKYIKVSERVKAFRMVYPTGYISTSIISHENGICVYRAECGYYDEENRNLILGVGTAREKEGTSYINKMSYVENCETSAVGRALGFAGFGIDYEIASLDEMNNKASELKTAIQNEPPPKDAAQPDDPLPPPGSWNPRNALSLWCHDHGLKMEEFGKLRDALVASGIVKDIKSGDLTHETFDHLCKAIQANYPDRLRNPA